MIIRVVFAVAAAALCSSGSATSAQEVRAAPLRIRDTPSCPRCRIEARLVATLLPPPGTHQFFPQIAVAEDGRGRFFVSPLHVPEQFGVYGPNGAFQAARGKSGEGAGRFLLAERIVIGSGDSIYVFDGLTLRMTVLTHGLRFVRAADIGARAAEAVIASPGVFVLHARIPTAARFGLPIHLMDLDGRISRSLHHASGSCANHDGVCAEKLGVTELVLLERALESNDVPALMELMIRFPDVLRPNRERGVVQVFDCQERVVAQFGLPDQNEHTLSTRWQ